MSNDKSPDGAITTVTFKERGGTTRVVVHDLYPSKEALDAAIASESAVGFTEAFEQLDELLVTVGASAGRLNPSPHDIAREFWTALRSAMPARLRSPLLDQSPVAGLRRHGR